MKRTAASLLIGLAIAALIALAACSPAAADPGTPASPQVLTGPARPQAINTMLAAVTATGAGTAIDLNQQADKFRCDMQWGGTVPTNVVWALEGSIDGTNYAALHTETSTASPAAFSVYFKPARWIRGNYVSKSNGDATTTVTVTCGAGGY